MLEHHYKKCMSDEGRMNSLLHSVFTQGCIQPYSLLQRLQGELQYVSLTTLCSSCAVVTLVHLQPCFLLVFDKGLTRPCSDFNGRTMGLLWDHLKLSALSLCLKVFYFTSYTFYSTYLTECQRKRDFQEKKIAVLSGWTDIISNNLWDEYIHMLTSRCPTRQSLGLTNVKHTQMNDRELCRMKPNMIFYWVAETAQWGLWSWFCFSLSSGKSVL